MRDTRLLVAVALLPRFRPAGGLGSLVSDRVAIDYEGNRWIVGWVLGDGEERCCMSNGQDVVEIDNPHEWQELFFEAGQITGDKRAACDLACERLKVLLQMRGT